MAYAVLCLWKLSVIFSNSWSFSQQGLSLQGLCCYNTLNYFSVKVCVAPCGCPGSFRSSLEIYASEFWMTSHFLHLISHFFPLSETLVVCRISWNYLSHSDICRGEKKGKTKTLSITGLKEEWTRKNNYKKGRKIHLTAGKNQPCNLDMSLFYWKLYLQQSLFC